MVTQDIRELVAGTADAAFAIDSQGLITAWNASAERLFGLSANQVVGRSCTEILQGKDECGVVCSEGCGIQQAALAGRPIANFDMQVKIRDVKLWCNVSVLVVHTTESELPLAVHILRPREMRKRLELLVRDFVVTQTDLAPDVVSKILLSPAPAASNVGLTARETQILRLLAGCNSTRTIAETFHISCATVNNHIRHILTKLEAHSRLEAVQRAQHSRLI